jgi:hypothetical protein
MAGRRRTVGYQLRQALDFGTGRTVTQHRRVDPKRVVVETKANVRRGYVARAGKGFTNPRSLRAEVVGTGHDATVVFKRKTGTWKTGRPR